MSGSTLFTSAPRQVVVRIIASALMAIAMVMHVTPAGAGTGNAVAAHACQQGNFDRFVRADGSVFADVGACVSYAARGGTSVPVELTATFVPNPARTDGAGHVFEDLTISGSGLQPGSTVTYSFVGFSTGLRSVTVPTEVRHIVASDGTFSTAWSTGCPLDHSFEFYATTAYGAAITATGC